MHVCESSVVHCIVKHCDYLWMIITWTRLYNTIQYCLWSILYSSHNWTDDGAMKCECVYIYIYMFVCMYICMYVCMYACMHAYMYVHNLHSILNTSAHCSRYQDLLQCTSITVQILLYFMFYTYWLMYGLWMIETCWRCDVLIINIGNGHSVDYNKIVYQIMHRINNNKHISQSF
jgi:hypothetical protein